MRRILRSGFSLGAAILCASAYSQELESFTVSQFQVVGGQSFSGTVTLKEPALLGTVVAISDNSSWIHTPGTVTVPTGARSATFDIGTLPVDNYYKRVISATAGRTLSKSVTLGPAHFSLTVQSTSVRGGAATMGIVRLGVPAPAGGLTLKVWDNSSAIQTPSSVTIPGGETEATFPIGTSRVSQTYVRNVFARMAGVYQKDARLMLTP